MVMMEREALEMFCDEEALDAKLELIAEVCGSELLVVMSIDDTVTRSVADVTVSLCSASVFSRRVTAEVEATVSVAGGYGHQ